MAANDYAAACKKFDASQKLDPAVGTLLFLGECNEKLNKTASAWAAFQEAASLAASTGDTNRQKIADVRAAALEPQVSKLQIDVASPSDDMQVKRDGVALPNASWGTPLPIDAGDHVVEATAPGMQPFNKTVSINDGGETISVAVPALQPAGVAPVPTPSGQPAPAPLPQPDDGSRGDDVSGLLITGSIVTGLGVVGLIVGGIFGASASSKNDESLENGCIDDNNCTAAGNEIRQDAVDQANIATIAFIVGGVLTAGGITLLIIDSVTDDAPGDDAATARRRVALKATPAGLLLEGTF